MLIGNGSILNRLPLRHRGAAGVAQLRSSFGASGALRNSQVFFGHTSNPQGYYPSNAYLWPVKAGNLSAFTTNRPFARMQASGELGADSFAVFNGIFGVLASGLLTVSATANFAAVSSFSANATATASALANFVGTFGSQAQISALAQAQAQFNAVANIQAAPRADGFMSANFGKSETLTSGAIAQSVWEYSLRTLTSAGGITSQQAQWLEDLAKIHGLIDGIPLVVGQNSRTAGSINQVVTEVGTTTTVTRV